MTGGIEAHARSRTTSQVHDPDVRRGIANRYCQSLSIGPAVVGPAAQRHVVVAAVVSQVHTQSVALEFTMGYGRTQYEKATGSQSADALGG